MSLIRSEIFAVRHSVVQSVLLQTQSAESHSCTAEHTCVQLRTLWSYLHGRAHVECRFTLIYVTCYRVGFLFCKIKAFHLVYTAFHTFNETRHACCFVQSCCFHSIIRLYYYNLQIMWEDAGKFGDSAFSNTKTMCWSDLSTLFAMIWTEQNTKYMWYLRTNTTIMLLACYC